jgi:hypothetical protein
MPDWTKTGHMKERTQAGNVRSIVRYEDEQTGICKEKVSILTYHYIPTGQSETYYYHPDDATEHDSFEAALASIKKD